ncbi:right-handed parallel beta-helix repeat-containing protein [Bartonella schoenbuchensis]|uniref:right-handed parallel beta-helix repeat-containing protein n=1 Tax=Bartonella schoenbuchensis TaxID=165694 RepID=UPI0031CC6EAC
MCGGEGYYGDGIDYGWAGWDGDECDGGDVVMTGTTVTGRGNTGTGVVINGRTANVTLNSVTMKQLETGARVTNGTLRLNGTTKIDVTGSGSGVSVSGSGQVMMNGTTTINVTGSGKGMYVKGGTVVMSGETTINVTGVGTGMEVGGSGGSIGFAGTYGVMVGSSVKKATLTNVEIVGRGDNGVGVWVKGGDLTVKGNTRITGVKVGIMMMGSGELKVEGGTKIEFVADGIGMYVGSAVTRATLTNVTIVGRGENGNGYGVLMMGSTGTLMMDGVNISKVETGVYAMGGVLMVSGGTIKEVERGIAMTGGTLTVEKGARIEFTGNYGVYVGDTGRATLTGVTITGEGGGGKGNGYGVYAMGQGTLMMDGVNISKVETGIYMEAGESLMVKGGSIGFAGEHGYGVKVGKSVTEATLTNVTITGSGKGDGIYAMGGNLTVSGVTIKEVERGIAMTGGGVLMVEGGTIGFMRDYGVYVGDTGRATLTDVEITGRGGSGVEDGTGVWVKGGEVMMKQVDISKVATGVVMSDGAMWLKETHFTNVKSGMSISEGFMRMEGGSVEFKGDYGIDLTRGYAFLGEVEIKGKETGQEGIKVSEGMLNLYKTNVRGVYKGMTVKEGSVVRMLEGEITFKGEHAISLTKGNAVLKNVSMTYKSDGLNANFIKVEGGKVLAEGITITGNGGKGQGVKVANGGTVWLKDTHFTNVKSGMSISEGSVFMFKGGITFKGDYGIYLSNKGHALLSDFDITGPGGTSKTTATGIGVVVSSLGEVMMRDVNISQVEMGARVTSGLLVMDKGGITFKGKHGVNLISGYALLNGVNIKGPSDKKSTGIELGYGQVLMKGTTFTNVDKAMTVTQGDVRMEGGEIEFKGEHGILLGQGGVALMGVTMRYKGNSTTADFIKITGEDTTNAVEAVDPKTKNTFTPKSAVVVAASLKIDGSGYGQALNVTNGGRVVLVNPTYTNVHTGMTITKGAVQMIEGSMEFKGGHGIYLKRGHALLTNVTMTYKGHEKNTTFLKVEATKVFNSKNERVLNTADIRVTGIKIDGKGYGQGVYVANGGRVMLQSALLSNVINGVSVANGEFWMKGGEIAFKGDYGVSLSTGKVVLKGVIMEYKGNNRGAKGANTASPNFIKVEGKGANLVAIKVMFTGNEQGLGVKVSNGGHVTLKHMFFCIVCECFVYFFLF